VVINLLSVRIQSTDGVRTTDISVVTFNQMPKLEAVNGVNGISQ
jgi:hypothetical protein